MKKFITLIMLLVLLSTPLHAAKYGKQTKACSGTNFDAVTLQPGCSTICFEEPCQVFFRMPRGKGKFRVYDDGIVIGDYPAGRKVLLGSFWKGSHTFRIPDAQVPPTTLYVGGSPY